MRSIDLVHAADCATPDAREVGWFAARQPGIIRFLEARCGASDGFAVALESAWRMCAAIEMRDGVPPRRIGTSLLERTEVLVGEGAARGATSATDGPPELFDWVDALLRNPPLPLSAGECRAVGGALLAIVYALEQVSLARAIGQPA